MTLKKNREDISPCYATVKNWATEFKQGRDITEVDRIHRMVLDDRRFTVQWIATSMGLSSNDRHEQAVCIMDPKYANTEPEAKKC